MLRFLGISLGVILTSFFLFPTTFVGLPVINTKNAMAVVGLIMLAVQLARQKIPVLDRGVLSIAIWAAFVSLMSFISITYNNTNDLSFVTYFLSMCIWLASAYMVVTFIYLVHGSLSVRIIANYMIAVCVIQCIIAYFISQFSALGDIINSIFITDSESLARGRLYGIGASLDVAGLRFMSVLVITAYMAAHLTEDESAKYLKWYVFSFFIIGLIGNMISRTTILGVTMGMLYWIGFSITGRISVRSNLLRLWKYLTISITAIVIGTMLLYQTSQSFRDSMHFGFEGFFSLYEKGKWEVSSNNGLIWMLKNIKPEQTRTWIIGDGYCDDPRKDPFYSGSQLRGGYYMGTDVGYMRFIFYFGILGTLVFIGYFCQVAYVCGKHFPHYKWMFLLILLCNFIGWVKVSTDIFVIFAVFVAAILFKDSKGYCSNKLINAKLT